MKKQQIHFKIPDLPPSVNKIYRHGYNGVYKIQEAKDFDELTYYSVPVLKDPISEPCKLVLNFFFKDKAKYKRSDVSNLIKVTEDAICHAGMISNDNLIVELCCTKSLGKSDYTTGYIEV